MNWRDLRRTIIARDGLVCGICHIEITPEPAAVHVDHVYPRRLGGPTHPQNLQVAHAKCNQAKGSAVPNGEAPPALPNLLPPSPTRRERQIMVKMTAAERDAVLVLARSAGVELATWMRMHALRATRAVEGTAMKALVVCTLLGMLLAAPVAAYDALDYCRDTVRADRLACHAQHLEALADCASDLAWNRWAEMPTADEDARACRLDANEACAECRALVEDCPTPPEGVR